MAVLEKVTTAENRFIVVLDEFQEVVKIQKGLDRQLRSLMQRQHNLNYILLGSQESMMEAIFEKKTSSFYHFGQMIRMGKIPYDDFHKYITDRIDAEGTNISPTGLMPKVWQTRFCSSRPAIPTTRSSWHRRCGR